MLASLPLLGAGAKLRPVEYIAERKAHEAEVFELLRMNNALREEMRQERRRGKNSERCFERVSLMTKKLK